MNVSRTKKITYEYSWHEHFLIGRVVRGGFLIGKVTIQLRGEHAKLADIKICDKLPINFSVWKRWLKIQRYQSFRNRGYGTILLKGAIDQLASKNVVSLYGVMHGDIESLTRWYQRLGFTVDAGTNNIFMDIV